MKRRWLLVLLSALLILGAACGGGDDDGDTDAGGDTETTENETPDGGETEAGGGGLTITAVDFAFKVPASVPAGETEITLENAGKEEHELQLVPLSDDAPDVEKLLDMPQKEAEKFFAGKPISIKPIAPGATETLNADLQPGTYGMVCFVVSKKEKKPHAFLGMYNQITVE